MCHLTLLLLDTQISFQVSTRNICISLKEKMESFFLPKALSPVICLNKIHIYRLTRDPHIQGVLSTRGLGHTLTMKTGSSKR